MTMLKNVHIKILIGIFIVFFTQFTIASDNENPKRSYVEYLTHPTTVLLTGITALSGYCWYDPEARTQAYEWSKQQFEWLKDQFCALHPVAKCATAGIGLWGLYAYCFNKKKAREEKKAQEALKRDNAILKVECILLRKDYDDLKMKNVAFEEAHATFVEKDYGVLKKDHEALQGDHNTMQAVYAARLKLLEDKDVDNDKDHHFYDHSLLAMQGNIQLLQDKDKANDKFKTEGLGILTLLSVKITALEQMAEHASSDDEGRVVSVTIKEVKELKELKGEEQDIPTNLNLKIAALAKMIKSDNVRYSGEGSSDDEGRVQSVIIKEDLDKSLSLRVKSNTPPISHSLFPEETLRLWGMRLRNLDLEVFDCEITEKSFGPYAELKKSNIGKLNDRIQEVIAAQERIYKWSEDYELNRDKLNKKYRRVNKKYAANAKDIGELDEEVVAIRENLKIAMEDLKKVRNFLALKFKGERI
jgi:hypothetical protein